MCLIIDANLAHEILKQPTPTKFLPLFNWLTQQTGGMVVIGGKLTEELYQTESVKRFLVMLNRQGRARVIPKEAVEKEVAGITALCVSNDAHVVALARVSGARLLCSHDTALHQDFINQQLIHNPPGHIYQNESHKHLLAKCGHTSACPPGRAKADKKVSRTKKP